MADGSTPGAGTEGLRRANASRVLRSLRDDGPASRAELAARTGLAKATVGVIVGGLEELGVLAPATDAPGNGSAARGRPARPVRLAGERHVGVGFELNVDYVAASVVDLAGRVVLSQVRPVTARDGLGELARLAAEVQDGLDGRRVLGATVAVPGLVRSDDRTVAWTPNLHLVGEDLARTIEGEVGPLVPVRVGNDADCAARAEARHGESRGSEHSLYLTGTVGVGAGIVDDGRVLRGASGFAGEVGHLPLAAPDARCGCGRTGCWEAAVGLNAMLAAVGLEHDGTPVAAAEEVARRAAHDTATREGLARVGRDLGKGLAVLVNVLDPEVVVLGGYFAVLAPYLLGPAREVLDAALASPAQRRPELRPGQLGIAAASLGAAELALAGVFTGDLALD